jgi:hypothetical protein
MKLGLILAFTILSLSQSFAANAETTEPCGLTEADLAANAKLSFDDFDQRGTTPATARKLGERQCYAEAARASEHYLLFGPELSESDRIVVAWHLGQYLATAGDEQAAARVLSATRRPTNPIPGDGFDWNTYVIGTWAFLTKDRDLLEASTKKLSAAPGERNAINARVLRALHSCYGKSYREALRDCIARP